MSRMPKFIMSCDEEVVRHGELQPCDKTTVAVRVDPDGGAPYAVCAFHARGEMVPLAELLEQGDEPDIPTVGEAGPEPWIVGAPLSQQPYLTAGPEGTT